MNRWLEADTTHLLPESKEDFEALIKALDDPPEPNAELRGLMRSNQIFTTEARNGRGDV